MLTVINDVNKGLFSPAQLNWHALAKEFANSVSIAEIIASDKENIFRRDLFESACKHGFAGLPFPTGYGGLAGDYVSFCLVNEEFARHCLPVMSALGVHVLCQEPIYKFGTENQKAKYLKLAATGKILAAFALTEPAAGSDTAALETTAHLENDQYILNGNKIFITSGSVADIYIVFARLINHKKSEQKTMEGRPEEKLGADITAFIIERHTPGLSVGQKFDMLGMRGYGTCEIVLTDCRIPKENILGAPGMGRKVALSSLAKGRVTIAAQAVGWARGALAGLGECLRQSKQSVSASINYRLGDLLVNIEAASALTYQAASSIDRGENDIALAGMAKLKATDVAMHTADQALSLTGILGLQPQYLLERIFRDAKAGQIYEGTNQIQRMLIARNIL